MTNARAKATQVHVDASGITAEQMALMAGAESALGSSLGKLMAIAEAYPDLKANQNFLQLQQELGDTEDKIQASRRFYNSTVMSLNTAIQTFPSNIIASVFGVKAMNLFELTNPTEAEPVQVKF